MTAKLLTLPPKQTDNRPAWQRRARQSLRQWRCCERITQLEAARRLQCSADAVSCWERGAREVPGWVLVAIGAVQRTKEAA